MGSCRGHMVLSLIQFFPEAFWISTATTLNRRHHPSTRCSGSWQCWNHACLGISAKTRAAWSAKDQNLEGALQSLSKIGSLMKDMVICQLNSCFLALLYCRWGGSWVLRWGPTARSGFLVAQEGRELWHLNVSQQGPTGHSLQEYHRLCHVPMFYVPMFLLSTKIGHASERTGGPAVQPIGHW